MKAFGFEVSIRKQYSSVVDNRGGWWPIIREAYSGAWQRNDEWTVDTVLAFHAVYSCITLIASDIGKLRAKLVQQDKNDIWTETQSAAFSPVLKKPNHYQTHIQFKEQWLTSKLTRGNTYVLKERDERHIVTAMYILDPTRVKVLVAPDGSVFYDLAQDYLSGLPEAKQGENAVPASEIIHDRMNCLFHPLVGTSPIFAAGAAANVGLNAQRNSSKFFANDSTPSGILTAPGLITKVQADELKERWQARDRGTIAVMGNGLTFEQLRMSAEDSQMIEHLKWTAETVANVFHVPAFKIGVGSMPTYSNGEILDQRYYSDCLQSHIEHMEVLLDEGLGIGVGDPKDGKILGVELDLDGLLRMDTATQVDTLAKGIGGALLTPNEARKKMDLKPLEGGDTVYLQQQNYSIEALNERDQDQPFSKPAPAPAALPPGESPPLALPPGEPGEKGDAGESGASINADAWDEMVQKYAAEHAVAGADPVLKALLFQAQSNAESLALLASRELPVPHVTVEGPTINVAPPDVSVTPPAVNVTVEASRSGSKTVELLRPDGSKTLITVKKEDEA